MCIIQSVRTGLEDVCRGKDEQLKVKDKEIEVLKQQLMDNEDQLSLLRTDLSEKVSTLLEKTERCGSLQAQLESSQRKLRALEVWRYLYAHRHILRQNCVKLTKGLEPEWNTAHKFSHHSGSKPFK